MSLYSNPKKSTSESVQDAVSAVRSPIQTRTLGSFSARLDAKLAELESRFASFITRDSYKQTLRRR